jgi:FAD/FMN-containing dehydrogenase
LEDEDGAQGDAAASRPTVNFSRKLTAGEAEIAGAASAARAASAKGAARGGGSGMEGGSITALPPMPQKHRAGGLRRMLSSLSVRRAKSVRGFERMDGWVVHGAGEAAVQQAGCA